MSKIVFVCYRGATKDSAFHEKVEMLTERLTPDNIITRSPQVITQNGVYIAIFNPKDLLPIKHSSVCMGNLIDHENDWWKPGASVPDGSYALFRSDGRAIELLTDVVASRTIWYVKIAEMFVASTSQRAIVFFLQDFAPNITVYAWMLTSGTLGPGLSWDRRIQCLAGNAQLFLDRRSWKMEIRNEPVIFKSELLSDGQHRTMLEEAIEDTFNNLKVDPTKWILPISGGYDSRAIFLLLRDRVNIKCLTWGLKSSLGQRNNDAYVAKQLTNYFSCDHDYWLTELSDESIEKILERFLIAGEGRIDTIEAYMDGFSIWKRLHESGYQGILRGDEAFGCKDVKNPSDIHRNMGLTIYSDYNNLRPIAKTFAACKQRRPEFLQQQKNESLADWRDRVNSEFEIPVKFAALNDLKLSYVEVINPLLSAKIVKIVRKLPEQMRTNKSLFKEIVMSISPDVPIAKFRAIADQNYLIKTEQAKNVVHDQLNNDRAKSILSNEIVKYIFDNIGQKSTMRSLLDPFKIFTNTTVYKKCTRKYNSVFKRNIIDIHVLAFRAYIICRMNGILSSDAQMLKNAASNR